MLHEEEKQRLEGKGVCRHAVRLRSKYFATRKGVLTKSLVKTFHSKISLRNFSRECKFCGRKENKWHVFFCNRERDEENEWEKLSKA